MYFRKFGEWGRARLQGRGLLQMKMIIVLFLFIQAGLVGRAFCQQEPKSFSKTKQAEKYVWDKNNRSLQNHEHIDPVINIGKIYIMPPEISSKSEKKRNGHAQNELLNLYRERQLIQKTLDRLEARASRRQKRAKKKTRRPCV